MAERIVPTPEQLRELLRYEPETGKLYWKARALSMFPSERVGKSWNTRYAGKQAFRLGETGYLQGNIVGHNVKAHRVAWAMYHGSWPEGDIDHKNLDRADNSISNLRVATRTENRMNTRAQKNGKSGYKGVYFHKRVGKWVAQINIKKKVKHLGYFFSAEEAHAKYCKVAKECYGEFARTE